MAGRYWFIMATLALALAAWGGQEGGQAGDRPEQTAEYVLGIAWQAGAPDLGALRERLRGSILAEAQKASGQPEGMVHLRRLNITCADSGHAATLEFTVGAMDYPGAVKAAEAIVAGVRKALVEQVREEIDVLYAQARDAVRDSEGRSQQLQGQAEKLREELRQRSGMSYASPQGVRAALEKLEQERQSLELDITGSLARKKAIQRTIAEQAERIEATAKEDAIAEQLKQIVETRATQVARVRQLVNSGQVPMSDLSNTEALLAEARAKLLERREQVASPGEALGVWNHELLNLSINLAEKEARLEAVLKRLDRLQSAAPLLDELEKLQADRDVARRAQERVLSELQDLQKQQRSVQLPRVTVLQGELGHME